MKRTQQQRLWGYFIVASFIGVLASLRDGEGKLVFYSSPAQHLEPNCTGKECCVEGEVYVPGGHYPLGETEQLRLAVSNTRVDVWGFSSVRIPFQDVYVDGFCKAVFPFHGVVGEQMSTEGLAESELDGFRKEVLFPAGIDLCTLPQLLVMTSAPDNSRYPYGNIRQDDEQPVCDTHPELPEYPIGHYDECMSGLGIHDLQVRGMWVRLDEEGVRLLSSTGAEGLQDLLNFHDYLVCGGNARYEQSLDDLDAFTCHSHPLKDNGGPNDSPYWDDFSGHFCRAAVPLEKGQRLSWAKTKKEWLTPDGKKEVFRHEATEDGGGHMVTISEYRIGCFFDDPSLKQCCWEKGYEQERSQNCYD